MKKTLLIAILICSFGGILVGCNNGPAPEKGYTKEDFAKRPPPPGYGPAGGAATQPDPEKTDGK
jgi:hypothetical protein